jgi:hypothetical protein
LFDLFPSAIFLRYFFQAGENNEQKLHDNRHGDVRHDTKHEYRKIRERTASKEVKIVNYRISGIYLICEIPGQFTNINSRYGKHCADSEYYQHSEGEKYPLP